MYAAQLHSTFEVRLGRDLFLRIGLLTLVYAAMLWALLFEVPNTLLYFGLLFWRQTLYAEGQSLGAGA